jgi:acyl carrier protein
MIQRHIACVIKSSRHLYSFQQKEAKRQIDFSGCMDYTFFSYQSGAMEPGGLFAVIRQNAKSPLYLEHAGVDRNVLKSELKHLIVKTLRLEEIKPDEIKDDAPLFGEGLGLDSIDALELVVALEKTYDVIIENEDVGKKAFASIEALADFVLEKKGLPQ